MRLKIDLGLLKAAKRLGVPFTLDQLMMDDNDGTYRPEAAKKLGAFARLVEKHFGRARARYEDVVLHPDIEALAFKLSAARDTIEDILRDPSTRTLFLED